jgi:transcriptional regulator GlxA family with amidase domain
VFTGVTLPAATGCLHERRFAASWPFYMSVMRHASTSGSSATGSAGWREAPDWTSDRGVWACASPVAATEAVPELIGTTAPTDRARAAAASPGTVRRLCLKHTGHLPGEYRRRYRLRTLRPHWGSEALAAAASTTSDRAEGAR